jgi:protein arginine kinase activator
MWCDECHEQSANVFIKKVVNGRMTEIKLCEECARHHHIAAPLLEGAPMQEFIETLLASAHQTPLLLFPHESDDEDAVCPRCGTTYDVLLETGRVGCAACYETFRLTLEDVIQHVHDSDGHAGKVPSVGQKTSDGDELQRLRQALTQAVADEHYEEAAQLRDQIRGLKGKKGL